MDNFRCDHIVINKYVSLWSFGKTFYLLGMEDTLLLPGGQPAVFPNCPQGNEHYLKREPFTPDFRDNVHKKTEFPQESHAGRGKRLALVLARWGAAEGSSLLARDSPSADNL